MQRGKLILGFLTFLSFSTIANEANEQIKYVSLYSDDSGITH